MLMSRSLLIKSILILFLTGTTAQELEAQIYVSNQTSPDGTIGVYDFSGNTIAAPLVSGLGGPVGMVVSGNTLYEANIIAGTIGVYSTDGTVINASLISGLENPAVLALSGNNLFVSNSTGVISEYTISGATVNATLIS